ncbi:unnamed protein product, partial [Ranitomeya imitator]
MKALLPDSAPVESESWDNIFKDIEDIIMPGVVHWQSPHMHAYFPALTSWPSLLGDMLADAINCLGFTWSTCGYLSVTSREQLIKRYFYKTLINKYTTLKYESIAEDWSSTSLTSLF